MEPYRGDVQVDGRVVLWETSFDSSVRFACVGCGYSCTNSNVEISPDELLRIEGVSSVGVGEKFIAEDGTLSLRIAGSDSTACRFLTQRKRCSIYEVRPSVCRIFPFKVVPISSSQARIDVTYGCTAMLTKHFAQENEVDFGVMVRDFLSHPFAIGRVYDGAKLHEQVKDSLDKDAAVQLCWASIVDEVGHLELFERLWDVLDAFEHARNGFPTVLRHSHAVEYIEKSLARFRTSRSVIAPVYESDFFLGSHARPYQCLRIATNEVYFFSFSKDGVRFSDATREYFFSQIKKKPMSEEAKKFLREYLGCVWDRQVVRQKIEERVYDSGGHSFSVMLATAKKKFLLFSFFMDAIAHHRGHDQIELDDAREAVYPFDLIFCFGR